MYLSRPGVKTMCSPHGFPNLIQIYLCFLVFPSMLEINFQGGITEHKAPFAHEHAEINELEDIVKELNLT